jgi:hypothetical protein
MAYEWEEAELEQDPSLDEYGLLPEQEGRLPQGPVAEAWGLAKYDEEGKKVYPSMIHQYADELGGWIDKSDVKSINWDALKHTADIYSKSTQSISDRLDKVMAQEGPIEDEDRREIIELIEHIPQVGVWQEGIKHMHRQWVTGVPFVPHFIHERKPNSPEYKEDKKAYEKFWQEKYYTPNDIIKLKRTNPAQAEEIAKRQDNGVMRYARGIQDFAVGAKDMFMGVFDNIESTKKNLGSWSEPLARISPNRLFKSPAEDKKYLAELGKRKLDLFGLLRDGLITAADFAVAVKRPEVAMSPMMTEAVLHSGKAAEKNPLAASVGWKMAKRTAKGGGVYAKGALTGKIKGHGAGKHAVAEAALVDKQATHQKRLERAHEGGHGGAVALAKGASKMAQSDIGFVKNVGNLILQSQRQGVLGMGLGKRFAGLEVTPEIQKTIIALEREARIKPMEVADWVNKVRETDPDAFAVVFDAINEGQAIAPQMHNLLKDIVEVRKRGEGRKAELVDQMIAGQEVKAQALKEGAQRSEMLPLEQTKYGLVNGRLAALKRDGIIGKPQTKYRRAERGRDVAEIKHRDTSEFLQRFENALSSKNAPLIDMMRREAVEIRLLNKKAATAKGGRAGQAKKILKEGFEYDKIARQIEEYNNGLVNFTYEGKNMRGLEFIIDGLKPESFDPSKVKAEIAFKRAENPALYDALAGRMDVLIQTRRHMDNFSKELATLVKDPKQRKILEESVFLSNVLGGYVPHKKAGLKELTGDRTGAEAFRDNLLLAKEKREKAKDWSANVLERAEGDQGAWQALLEYTLNATNMINKAKLHKGVVDSLGKHNKIFENKAEFVRATGLPETKVKSIDLHRQGRLGHDTWQMIQRGIPYEWVEVAKSKDPLLPIFGQLEGKVIPKHVYHHLANYDAAYGAVRQSSRVLQDIFKQSKTIYGLPYYFNTAMGLAVLQMLDGGTPLELMNGIVEYGKKGEVYTALRDAGGIRESAMLLGVDAPKQNVFGKLGKLIHGKTKKLAEQPSPLPPSVGGGSRVRTGVKGGVKEFSKFLTELYEGWQDPVQMQAAKKYGVPAAAIAAGGVVGAGLTGGLAGGALIGMLNGLAASRGPRLSMLMDQGARIASATRLINQYANVIAGKMAEARGKKSSRKQKEMDVAAARKQILKNKELMKKISTLADKANIDYTLLPMSVEHFSAAGPISPFIKFATRATELLYDSPEMMPKRFLQLNEVERQYLNDMTPEQWKFREEMPWGEQMMGYLPRNETGNYWSAAYWNPLTMAVVRESMPLITMMGGWFGGAAPWSSKEAFKAEVSGSATRLLNYGWLKPIVESFGTGRGPRGEKLDTAARKAKNLATGLGPSSVYRMSQLMEVLGNTTNETDYGLTQADVVTNALGPRNKPVHTVKVQQQMLDTEYDSAMREFKGQMSYLMGQAKNDDSRYTKLETEYKEGLAAIREAYERARDSDFFSRQR